MVLAAKPVISDTQDALDPALLRELLGELGTLASVYHKPAHAFVSRAKLAVQRADDLAAGAARRLEEENSGGWALSYLFGGCVWQRRAASGGGGVRGTAGVASTWGWGGCWPGGAAR